MVPSIKQWLWRAESDQYEYSIAVHLLRYTQVGDEKERKRGESGVVPGGGEINPAVGGIYARTRRAGISKGRCCGGLTYACRCGLSS